MGLSESPIRRMLGSTELVRGGHRGAAHLAPENTLASLEVAIEYGVDIVEFDVVRDTHGDLVVAHDATDTHADTPSFAAALGLLSREMGNDTTIDLDLKVGDAAAEIVALLEQFELIERTLVTALHSDWLRDVRDQHAVLALGLSYPRDRTGVADREALRPLVRAATSALRATLPFRVLRMAAHAHADAVMLHHSVVSSSVVRRCGTQQLPVFAWTVDDAPTAQAMVAAGVHGIISNDPRVFDQI